VPYGGGGGGGTALPIYAPGWQLGCMYQLRGEAAGRLAHSEWATRRTGRFAYLNGLGAAGRGKARLTDLQFVILKGSCQFVQFSSATHMRHGPL
jgi:hypothetical protein